MSKQAKVITTLILVVVLLMGIGYAALSNITLTIGGSASAIASDDNFKVYFTGPDTFKTSNDTNVTVTVNNGAIDANVEMTGFTKAGDTEYAILEIENGSNGINATSVNVETSGDDTEYFDIEAVMCTNEGVSISDYALPVGAKTYVKVTATLKVTPTENVSTDINVKITAVPAEN